VCAEVSIVASRDVQTTPAVW